MIPAKKLSIWLPLLFAIVMIAGMSIGFKLRENTTRAGSLFKMRPPTPLQEVLDLVQLKYVDTVRTDTLADDAIRQMLVKLDPHSVFIPAVALGDVNEDLQGNFQGIGVEFNIFDDTVHVVTVLENGPSEKAGLEVGDRFLKVGDSSVAGKGITSARIRKLLRGPGASKVTVTMLRNNKPMQFLIQRGTIPLPSVDAAYMSGSGEGYIHINRFSENTYREFMQALEKLQQQGMKKLLLDLRDNGGGILQEAINIADEFLDGDKLIVFTLGAHSPRQEYHCKRPGLFETGRLAVLVNEGTASASEVLVGALQDWDRAEVIGRRTFGKGLVQEQYDLSNGAAVRLTVARYYTPSGRSIQKPYNHGEGAYENDIMNRYHHGEMTNADSNHIKNGKIYKTSSGRPVYGGGGIMPDVFVAADTSTISRTLARLYTSNTMSNFAYRYFIANRQVFADAKSPVDFYTRYKGSSVLWDDFSRFAGKDSIDITRMTANDRRFAERRLLALMARQQWRSTGFFEVLNAHDITVNKGFEELSK